MATYIKTIGAGSGESLALARILWQDITHLSDTVISGTTPDAGFSFEALRYPTTYEGWKPFELPATLTITPEDPAVIDGVLIAGHNLGSVGATVTVTAGSDSIEITPTDNSPIFVIFDKHGSVPVSSVSLSITGDQAPAISVVMAGKCLVMERAIFTDFAPSDLNRTITIGNQKSVGGQALGFSVRRQGAETAYNWKLITPKFLYGEDFQAFKNYAETGRGFFGIAWRPSFNPAQLGTSPGVQYGSLTGAMTHKVVAQPNHLDISFTMTSAGPIR